MSISCKRNDPHRSTAACFTNGDPPTWTWTTGYIPQPPCDHCYCQAATYINGVPHTRCHKCKDRRADHLLTMDHAEAMAERERHASTAGSSPPERRAESL